MHESVWRCQCSDSYRLPFPPLSGISAVPAIRLPRQLGVKLVNPIKQHVSDTERDAGNGMDNDLQPLSQFLPAQETSRNAATRLI